MQEEQIRREIASINFNFDMETIKRVRSFLGDCFEASPASDTTIRVIAATAIVCETSQLATMVEGVYTHSGVALQDIMKHTEAFPRSSLLATVEQSAKEMREPNQSLIGKIQKLKQSYHIFKAYEDAFAIVGEKCNFPASVLKHLLCLYWMIFLNLKAEFKGDWNQDPCMKMLKFIIFERFVRVYLGSDREIMNACFNEKNQLLQASFLQQSEQIKVRRSINKMILLAEERLRSRGYINEQNFVEQPAKMDHLLNELDNLYDKNRSKRRDHINEATFLRLNKNLSPIPFKNQISKQNQIIAKKLNFDSDDDSSWGRQSMDFQNNSDDQQNPKNKQKAVTSTSIITIFQHEQQRQNQPPFSLFQKRDYGQQKDLFQQKNNAIYGIKVVNDWVKGYVEKQDLQKVEKEIRRYLDDSNFQCIKACCQDIYPSYPGVWNFFMVIFNDYFYFSQQKKDQPIEAFSQTLLCLCLGLYYERMEKFNEYLLADKIDLLKCLQRLEALKVNPEIPLQRIQILQKHILVSKIWETAQGYQLLRNFGKDSFQIIFKRLRKYIQESIKEICVKQLRQYRRQVEKLIEQLFKMKPELFLSNKLQPIVLCSVMACLSVNQTKNARSIACLCSKNVKFSSSDFNQLSCKEGHREISLRQYYQMVFLPAISEFSEEFLPLKRNHSDLLPSSKSMRDLQQGTNRQKDDRM